MKNKLFSAFTAALLLIGCSFAAKAQTVVTNQVPNLMPPSNDPIVSGIESAAQAALSSTNWTAAAVGGVDTTGKKYLVAGEFAYGFNQYVGLIAGVEGLYSKGTKSQFSAVKGGLTLSYPLHPFACLGSTPLTNIVASPFVSDQIATPSGGSNLGNLLIYGLNFNVLAFANFELVAGFDYEQRTGQGFWDGDFYLIHAGLNRRF